MTGIALGRQLLAARLPAELLVLAGMGPGVYGPQTARRCALQWSLRCAVQTRTEMYSVEAEIVAAENAAEAMSQAESRSSTRARHHT